MEVCLVEAKYFQAVFKIWLSWSVHEHSTVWKKSKGRSLLYTLQEEVRNLFIFIKMLTLRSTFNLAKTFYSQMPYTCTQNCIRQHNRLSRVLAFSKCKCTYFLNYLLSLLTYFKKGCVHEACQHGKCRATLRVCVCMAGTHTDRCSLTCYNMNMKGRNGKTRRQEAKKCTSPPPSWHIFPSLCGSDSFILLMQYNDNVQLSLVHQGH